MGAGGRTDCPWSVVLPQSCTSWLVLPPVTAMVSFPSFTAAIFVPPGVEKSDYTVVGHPWGASVSNAIH